MKRIPTASSALAGLLLIVSAHAAAGAGGRTPLSDAIKDGDAVAIRTLVKGQASVNVADADGTTPLHWATDKDDVATAKLLIAAGAKPGARNRYGVTPMYSATVSGDAAMIDLLLKAGADANVALPEGETALMTASRTGKVDAIKLLIAHGAAVNNKEKWKQQTALMWAANEGNTEAVKVLVAAGANLDDRSIFGWTPYLLSARQGNIDTIEALLAAGVDVNQTLPDGTSALITATQGLNYETAALLLKYGINPNASGQGWTALHQIAWSRRPQRGQNNPGQKPKGSVSSLELAKMLVEYGADVNARETKEPATDMEGRNNMNRTGATAVLLASKSCDVPLVETLLALGADPFISTVEGTSPLMAAAGVGIFSQGESPGEPEESADAVSIFLGLGASATDVDKNGETALHGPAWRGSNEAVTLLVNAGAKLDARNNRGWQPLTIADGVYINARVMMMPHTAKLLRDLMNARGLNTEEKDTNFGGAMRDRAVVDDQLNGQSPAEIQRKLVEQQQKQQQEATKKLKQLEGIEN